MFFMSMAHKLGRSSDLTESYVVHTAAVEPRHCGTMHVCFSHKLLVLLQSLLGTQLCAHCSLLFLACLLYTR